LEVPRHRRLRGAGATHPRGHGQCLLTTLVPQAVATPLGVREERERPLLATLTDALRLKRLLLLLDNCEHLLDACATLADTLLRACPHLTAPARA
jgi:non-specific serine/threonine protein kinase